MRALVIATGNPKARRWIEENGENATVRVYGLECHFGLVEIGNQRPRDQDNRTGNKSALVTLRVLGFSCNYRDRTLIFATASRDDFGFYVLGSDFVGEVIGIDGATDELKVGDLVIPNNNYGLENKGGIPTNGASREVIHLKEHQLLKVPSSMPLGVAAGFGLAAQTTYCMLRKAQAHVASGGSQALIAGGGSNTSQWLANVAECAGFRIHRRSRFGQITNSCGNPMENPDRRYDVIFDPFVDANLAECLPFLRDGGLYLTCGLSDQIGGDGTRQEQGYRHSLEVLAEIITRNISLQGSCLGTTRDLQHALTDYEEGQLSPPIGKLFRPGSLPSYLDEAFVNRTTNGKPVFLY